MPEVAAFSGAWRDIGPGMAATPQGFATAVALPISDGATAGYDAAIASDESFIVFSSNRAPASSRQSLLFVAFAHSGRWTPPAPLQPVIKGIEARLSPDLKVLYFSVETPVFSVAGSTKKPASSQIFQMPIPFNTGNSVGSHSTLRSLKLGPAESGNRKSALGSEALGYATPDEVHFGELATVTLMAA